MTSALSGVSSELVIGLISDELLRIDTTENFSSKWGEEAAVLEKGVLLQTTKR